MQDLIPVPSGLAATLSNPDLAHSGCRVEESLPARLREAVETASVISAELQSLHRQHVTAGMLLQQEEARSRELAQEVKAAQVPQISSACSRPVVPAATRPHSSCSGQHATSLLALWEPHPACLCVAGWPAGERQSAGAAGKGNGLWSTDAAGARPEVGGTFS